ncbi:MAG: RNase adapter RapZ [Solirubrobacteraceae bacterium]|nr:RNase adapter RapZ [Solirubrobacteraceae bacterium]
MTDATASTPEDPATDAATGEEVVLRDFVVITGYSGAGKSTTIDVFEDQGYFCVDNLPPEMIGQLVELFRHPGSKVERAAVVCDVRGGSYFKGLQQVLEDLRAYGTNHRVVFLRADEDVLISRYKETRRRHPLAPHGSVADGIAAERKVLARVEELAETVIDSGGLTVHDLRRRIVGELLPREATERMSITFESFGFKRGAVRDADLVFDVRFLPNPHWDPALRAKNGRDDPDVGAYVARDGTLADFYDRLLPLLDFLLPRYAAEGKAHVTIGIGCTGGRHRSVLIAEQLTTRYGASNEFWSEARHRDLGLGG